MQLRFSSARGFESQFHIYSIAARMQIAVLALSNRKKHPLTFLLDNLVTPYKLSLIGSSNGPGIEPFFSHGHLLSNSLPIPEQAIQLAKWNCYTWLQSWSTKHDNESGHSNPYFWTVYEA